MLENHSVEILGTVFLGLAVLHTFLVKQLLNQAHRFPDGGAAQAVFHLLGEIEIVFGFWAMVFMLLCLLLLGPNPVVNYIEGVSFTEAIFVFVVMTVASTRPIMWAAEEMISMLSKALTKAFSVPGELAAIGSILILGPLAGSLITEPAAMTVSALLLYEVVDRPSQKFLYSMIAVLFVNVSIGGALTHFAAPPILMVAGTWQWNTAFVFSHFGWKSLVAVLINTLGLLFFFRGELKSGISRVEKNLKKDAMPAWVLALHIVFLLMIVLCAHWPKMILSIFLFFLGITVVTKKFQTTLRLRESLLVAFFLGGIIVFGAFQRWWLQPLIGDLGSLTLFFSSVGLTAITDNAALTYLGSQVPNLSPESKYYLVAGAIAGGGLTVIANAPNAAGYSILQKKFKDGFSPVSLFWAALPPTIIAVLCLEFLPHL